MSRGLGRRLDGMVESVVGRLGYELVAIEKVLQGRDTVLRIYIDTLEPATAIAVEDCERVSRQLSALFDVEEPVTGHYSLEVSSPGLDRLLTKAEHFVRFAGERARLKLARPVDGRRQFVGTIGATEGDVVHLDLEDGGRLEVGVDEIEQARLVPSI